MIPSKFDSSYLISASDLLSGKTVHRWDFHIHTNFTDGAATVREVFQEALRKDLEILAFTEHTEPWRSNQKDWFKYYVEDIKKCRNTYRNKIVAFIGVEANAVSFSGDIELSPEMEKDVEFILGAVHRYPGLEGRKTNELSAIEAIDLEYRTLLGLIGGRKIDAIAHIGATCSKYCAPFPTNLTREIIRAATRNQIAVEINPVHNKPLLSYLEMCAEENAMIVMGSDAHNLKDVGLVVKEIKSIFL